MRTNGHCAVKMQPSVTQSYLTNTMDTQTNGPTVSDCKDAGLGRRPCRKMDNAATEICLGHHPVYTELMRQGASGRREARRKNQISIEN